MLQLGYVGDIYALQAIAEHLRAHHVHFQLGDLCSNVWDVLGDMFCRHKKNVPSILFLRQMDLSILTAEIFVIIGSGEEFLMLTTEIFVVTCSLNEWLTEHFYSITRSSTKQSSVCDPISPPCLGPKLHTLLASASLMIVSFVIF